MKNILTSKRVYVFHVIWLVLMFAMVLRGGVRHDYVSYVDQWALVLSSPNPWATDNAYGPLHAVLAYATVLGILGPKIFICASFAVMDTLLLVYLLRNRGCDDGSAMARYILAIPLNGAIVFLGFWYGLNDLLVASFILAAILARLDRHFMLMGVLVGLAALLKFYPLLLLPFLSFDDNCIRLRASLSCTVVFLLGIGTAWLKWGNVVLTPLVFGSGREPKLLSILASLSVHPWLIGGRRYADALVRYNTFMVAGVAVLAIWLCWRRGLSWLSSFVIGSLAILLIYKVGHPQFYMSWLVAIAALPLLKTKRDDQTAWICMPFVLFLSIFQSLYTLGTEMTGPWQIVRDNVGFLAITMGTLIIYMVMRVHRNIPSRLLVLTW